MLKTASFHKFNLSGEAGELADNIIINWLIGLRESNPAILDMFRDRDIKPYRDLLPWSGEFAGKYITGAYYIYKATGDHELYEYIMKFISEFLSCQNEGGYLGCFCKGSRLTGATSLEPDKIGTSWDIWNHYHAMYGLYLWYGETKDQKLFNAVEKIADLLINTFYQGKKRLIETGSTEMNLACYHMFAILYDDTKERKYLDFALEIEKDFSEERAGNYIGNALEGLEYYQFPVHRWESLHIIMGIAKMYECTQNKRYLDAAKNIFYSILNTDVHNTGAFSTNEQAVGTPFKNGAIETCCVIAYNALALEMLKLTGDLRIADFLELSLFNAVMGYYSPTGRWSAYHTPMDGEKCANFHSINFQCRPGSPELNCCSVNAPRGVGMVSQWAVMEDSDTFILNYFDSFSAVTQNGLSINMNGDYPVTGKAIIHLNSEAEQKIAIRIPYWSENTIVTLGDSTMYAIPGTYLTFIQKWNHGTITVQFDFSTYYLYGKEDFEGKVSIYRGPVLYGYDLSLNPEFDFDSIPAISKDELKEVLPQRMPDGRILLKLKNGITLCDFCHLGMNGSRYKTWLTVK